MGTDGRAPARLAGLSGADIVAVLAASACVGLAVSAMLTLSRVPASADFLLPRRPFYPFFEFFMAAQRSPSGRGAAAWTSLALIAAGAGLLAWRLAAAVKRRKAGWLAAAGCLAGCVLAAGAGRDSLASFMDVLQNASFPPENLDIREPGLAFMLAGATTLLCGGSALSLAQSALSGGFLKRWRAPAAWGLVLACWWASAAVCGAGNGARLTLALAAGVPDHPSGTAALLVLGEGDVPSYEVREVELGVPGRIDYSPESLAELERFGGRMSVHRLSALRHVYTGRAALSDAQGMRRAALAAVEAGDPLARLNLLGNLAHAPASEENAAMLAVLADETRWRVGPHAAVMLADAFRRLGDSDRASNWLGRASQGGSPIPAGLLASADTGRFPPACVRGRIAFSARVRRLKASLYFHDRTLPADFSPMALAASTVLDAKGGFEFPGMPAGDYILALELDPRDGRDPKVSGHKGDIRVAGKDVTVPVITLR